MIIVGIDDTDTIDSRGTNHLAREIVRRAADHWRCQCIVRHQLLFDSRIPYTSHNGSASMSLEPLSDAGPEALIELCRQTMRDCFIPGSDPGLCVAKDVGAEVIDFGRRCQLEIVTQDEPRKLALRYGIHLEGLGGTEGGVIGALAAVGLATTGNDGRIVQWRGLPDDLSGLQSIEDIHRRGVVVRDLDEGSDIPAGMIDIGKRLRPNLRARQAVVFARRNSSDAIFPAFTAIRMP